MKKDPAPQKIEKAIEEEVDIVTLEFITDSIAQARLLSHKKYSIIPVDESENDSDFINDDGEVEESESELDDAKKRKSSSGVIEPKPKRQKSEAVKNESKRAKSEGAKKAPRPAKKVPRPQIDTEAFLKKTGDIPVTLTTDDGNVLVVEASPRKFSTGSVGWTFAGKKLKVKVGANEVTANVTGNFIIRGSKPKSADSPTDKKAEKESKAEPTPSQDSMEIETKPSFNLHPSSSSTSLARSPSQQLARSPSQQLARSASQQLTRSASQQGDANNGFVFQPPPVPVTPATQPSEGWASYLKNCTIQ
jgi:hypothetical protein